MHGAAAASDETVSHRRWVDERGAHVVHGSQHTSLETDMDTRFSVHRDHPFF
jgi:hypothetical protein